MAETRAQTGGRVAHICTQQHIHIYSRCVHTHCLLQPPGLAGASLVLLCQCVLQTTRGWPPSAYEARGAPPIIVWRQWFPPGKKYTTLICHCARQQNWRQRGGAPRRRARGGGGGPPPPPPSILSLSTPSYDPPPLHLHHSLLFI